MEEAKIMTDVKNELARVLNETEIHREDGKEKWYRISDLITTVERFYGAEIARLFQEKFTAYEMKADEFSDFIMDWFTESYQSKNNISQEPRHTQESLASNSEETYEDNKDTDESKEAEKCTCETLQQSFNNSVKEIKMRFFNISESYEESFIEKSSHFQVRFAQEINQIKNETKRLREELGEHLQVCPPSLDNNSDLELRVHCIVSKKTHNFIIWCKEQIEDLKEVQNSQSLEIDELNKKTVYVNLDFVNDFNDQLSWLKESQEKHEANFLTLSRKISNLTDHVDELNFAIENLAKLKSKNDLSPEAIKRPDHEKSLIEEFNYEKSKNHLDTKGVTFVKMLAHQKSLPEELTDEMATLSKRADHQKQISIKEEIFINETGEDLSEAEEINNETDLNAATFSIRVDHPNTKWEDYIEENSSSSINSSDSTFSNEMDIIRYRPQVFASTPVQRKEAFLADKTEIHLKNTTHRRLKYCGNDFTKNVSTYRNGEKFNQLSSKSSENANFKRTFQKKPENLYNSPEYLRENRLIYFENEDMENSSTSKKDESTESVQSPVIDSLSSESSSSESTHFKHIVNKKFKTLDHIIFDHRSKYFENQPSLIVSSSKNDSSENVLLSKNERSSLSSSQFEKVKKFKNLCIKTFSFKSLIKMIFITLAISVAFMFWILYSKGHDARRFQKFLISLLYEIGFADRVERRGPLPH